MSNNLSGFIGAVDNLRADLEKLDVTKSPLQREVERLRERVAELEMIVTDKGVLNTIKVLAYEMSKTMIGMADKFSEQDVRANIAKLDEVLAWVESVEKKGSE